MSVDEQLYARLRDDAALAALVGTRIFPLLAPQDAPLPFIRYQLVSRVADEALDAVSTLASYRFQIDAYGATYASARAVQARMKELLNGWAPDTGPIERSVLINVTDRHEGDDARKLYRTSQDYQITADES
jgi:hypothetical protein